MDSTTQATLWAAGGGLGTIDGPAHLAHHVHLHMAMAQNYGTNDPQISDHGHSRKTIQLLGVDNFEP